MSFDQSPKKIENTIKQLLFKAKLQVKDIIDAKFSELEKQTLMLIEKQNRELGLHSEAKISAMMERLQSEIEAANAQIYELRGEKCLSTVIHYLNAKQEAIEETVQEVTEQIQVTQTQKQQNFLLQINQAYKIEASVNDHIFGDFGNLVNQMLNIKFAIPPLKASQNTSLAIAQPQVLLQPSSQLPVQSQTLKTSPSQTMVNFRLSNNASVPPSQTMNEFRRSGSSTNFRPQQFNVSQQMAQFAQQIIQPQPQPIMNDSQQRFFTPSKPSLNSSISGPSPSLSYNHSNPFLNGSFKQAETPKVSISRPESPYKPMPSFGDSAGFARRVATETRGSVGFTPHVISKQGTSRIEKRVGISLETSQKTGKENKEMRPNLYAK